jgi:hypothetical protein
MSGYVLFDFRVDLDRPSAETATEVVEALGFEVVKVVNLGDVDLPGDSGRWRANAERTVVVVGRPKSRISMEVESP